MAASQSIATPPGETRWRPKERAVIGIIQIATDLVMDTEGAALVAQLPGVNVRMAKIAFDAEEICAETYEDAYAKGRIKAAVDSVSLPRDYITCWGVSCTSLSFILGSERLASQFPAGAQIVTMWEAVVKALKALDAKRIAVVTPYITAVHSKNVELCQKEGFTVVRSMYLNLDKDLLTSAVDPEYIADCAVSCVGTDNDIDAVFLGCSAFRACEPRFISKLESTLGGIPVVTSTQAFLWHALRTAGVRDTLQGYGKLFAEENPAKKLRAKASVQ